jgi:hypothetical protein
MSWASAEISTLSWLAADDRLTPLRTRWSAVVRWEAEVASVSCV